MADTKTSDLTALTGANVVPTDLFPVVDIGSTESKKITAAELLNFINVGLLFEVLTVTTSDATYAPTSTFEVINLNNASTDIDIVYAAVIPVGSVVVYHATDNGAASHTVKLAASQTFDGTNNTADFNAADDRLVVVALSATRVLICYNNSVTFSST